jgi:hypothetical protein
MNTRSYKFALYLLSLLVLNSCTPSVMKDVIQRQFICDLATIPEGSQLFFNGEYQGRSPMRLTLPSGTDYEVWIVKDGFVPTIFPPVKQRFFFGGPLGAELQSREYPAQVIVTLAPWETCLTVLKETVQTKSDFAITQDAVLTLIKLVNIKTWAKSQDEIPAHLVQSTIPTIINTFFEQWNPKDLAEFGRIE